MDSSSLDTSSLTGDNASDALGVIGDIATGVLKIVAASLGAS